MIASPENFHIISIFKGKTSKLISAVEPENPIAGRAKVSPLLLLVHYSQPHQISKRGVDHKVVSVQCV